MAGSAQVDSLRPCQDQQLRQRAGEESEPEMRAVPSPAPSRSVVILWAVRYRQFEERQLADRFNRLEKLATSSYRFSDTSDRYSRTSQSCCHGMLCKFAAS